MRHISDISIVKFCAEECERQQSGEMSVYRMVSAYHNAYELRNNFVVEEWDILFWGGIIDPDKNSAGYRRIPVTFANGNHGLQHNLIPRAMSNLLNFQNQVSPEALYQEFESIHPFEDGNGRVGSILYNVKKGTMDNPVVPPEYKDSMDWMSQG